MSIVLCAAEFTFPLFVLGNFVSTVTPLTWVPRCRNQLRRGAWRLCKVDSQQSAQSELTSAPWSADTRLRHSHSGSGSGSWGPLSLFLESLASDLISFWWWVIFLLSAVFYLLVFCFVLRAWTQVFKTKVKVTFSPSPQEILPMKTALYLKALTRISPCEMAPKESLTASAANICTHACSTRHGLMVSLFYIYWFSRPCTKMQSGLKNVRGLGTNY